MELKPFSLARPDRSTAAFNRTIVELKPAYHVMTELAAQTFNRTIVELKLVQAITCRNLFVDF